MVRLLIRFICCLIMINATPAPCFAKTKPVKIGIISDYHYCGEREVAWRIKMAAESLGWEATIDEYRGRKIKDKQFDWVMCLVSSGNDPNI